MFSTALPTEIRGGVCTGPTSPKEDGATARGPGRVTLISDRVFDFRDYPAAKQDEVISGVDGAIVRLQRCVTPAHLHQAWANIRAQEAVPAQGNHDTNPEPPATTVAKSA